ncbi:type II toxin-antitoxin system RelE/ParE family toxin [Candidatus Collierbacteria bacterium CG10_big_fil_rev_8_21_14_0_10_43_36]|uniref:Type II toxin-antitoxin system mRNA interferase toxin, RelE/StbE family n=3 Tax=Candidatus Collieribacteriota TaxID=1752725 RepID=A0A2H0DU77_9BACT|nr:type II toxin-antitoxin system RelE/ParE family toxin [bacterium]PIP85712.1 MAG: type II toxin-antitoxin system mRNA interferase toxin, RelE/StbE family [Candidatus Collierbacteria bacterium CG22_combo_CG10-13_8_21_14_all_43_12]PIR99344.1 MAG: type II toxin-antitoxin system RelE/ParE family toxin [Candidatus Collierbacteria bacterium CG10_big_fil_rev_8_21_14_0_10_43_36]PIZ24767.1 MAG: type II toxin-antitoxin system RelE/ParE family toxin [Candidatus Collierbacteria bacterium CG_4_10_14_0_8_um
MKITLSSKAERQYKSLGKAVQIITTKRIRDLGNGERIQEKKLSGYKDIFRTRVGDYRLVYKKTSTEVFIVLIGHRREIYRLLKDLF